MITDINSLISNQGKPANTNAGSASIGALAKLSNELKLIQGMQPIQITSVRNGQSPSGQPSQLIGVTQSNQQQLTLINQEINPNIKAGDRGTLNVTANTATLTVSPQTTLKGSTNTLNSPLNQGSSQSQTSAAIPTTNSSTNNVSPQQAAKNPLANGAAPANSSISNDAKISARVAIASQPITLTALQSSTVVNTSTSTSQQTAQYSTNVTDGKEVFTLNTRHPIQAGETLSVMVDKTGKLQLYPQNTVPPRETTITEGLKQSLPKQITPQEFTNMLRQLTTMSQTNAPLPERVTQALEQLIRQLPNLQSLTQSPESLKQAIQSSGIFSENNLANNTQLAKDFKLNLSRLDGAASDSKSVSQLNNAPAAQTQALNLVAGAIERITTHQLRNIVESVQQDGQTLPLSIELPVKDGKNTSLVNIRIDRDAGQNNEVAPHDRRWLVQLKFDFEETGRFEARVSIQGQKVGVIFAVEEAETEQLIRTQLSELRDNLRKKNVEIETMDCFRAQLKEAQKFPYESPSTRLIDVRT